MRVAIAAVLALGGAERHGREEPEIWVFFSPDSPDASRLLADLRGMQVRPVLLAERYAGAREPSPAFLETVKAAGEVRVVDEEGLREAVRLNLSELPAVAVRRRGRTHVASGNRIDVREVLRCSR